MTVTPLRVTLGGSTIAAARTTMSTHRKSLCAFPDDGAYAVAKALFELLTEEQEQACRIMDRAGRRNAAPARREWKR